MTPQCVHGFFHAMNRNLLLITLVLIAGIAGFLSLNAGRKAVKEPDLKVDSRPQEAPSAVQAAPEQDVSENQKRIARMRSAYAELEQARDSVRRQLGRLRSRTWKLQVSPDQARAITGQMQQGYAILRNPPMLGAFSNADEIRQELAKVTRIADKLSALEITVREYIAAQETR